MIRKAVQQIMLGTVTRNENETRQTLAAIREAGYDALELNGFMIRKTPMMVRMMTKAAGMPAGRGGSYDWPALLREAGLGAVAGAFRGKLNSGDSLTESGCPCIEVAVSLRLQRAVLQIPLHGVKLRH